MKTSVLKLFFLTLAASIYFGHSLEKGKEKSGEGLPPKVQKPEAIKFKHSSFTFVRIKYSGSGGHTADRWAIDYPGADLNFTARFHQETGLKVHTNGLVLELTDPRLKQYPFIYIAEGGRLQFNSAEIQSLRAYLLGGGFLMTDDFWGEAEWRNFYREIKRVFPEDKYEPKELPLDHPIFHCVYDLKEKPQVPNVTLGIASLNPGPYFGVTWERPDAKEVHFRGMFDDTGRLMAIFCHNTDLGDGWECNSKNQIYFREFSLKKAFPMGINIVVHALTH